MLDVYWLEQTEVDVPPSDDWLCANETVRLHSLRLLKRRTDWRLGRWAAKRALAVFLNLPTDSNSLANIEIRPAQSGAPQVFLANREAPVTISLSHRGGWALCAVAWSPVALGCDLEIIEPRADAFVADFFSTEEQSSVACSAADDRSRLITLLWSSKESALKALHQGLRIDTRSVVVHCMAAQPGSNENNNCDHADSISTFASSKRIAMWSPLRVRHTDQTFSGWWQQNGNLLRTLVAIPSPSPPIQLKLPTN